MNKDDGKRLIQDTLQNTFSKERFIYFVKNLLNDYDESKAFHAHGYVLEIYRNFVKTYERLGTYTDPTGKKIDIIIVYLQKETSIDKARTAQRNFIAQYLKDRGEKDAGLIAFVSPNLEDWRFSFVKMEYRFEETKDGKVKAKESFTPAKRYSFLVGPHEASHTAQSRMLPIILNDSINPTLDEIEDIFSVEKATDEFFERYKDLFLNFADQFSHNSEFNKEVVEKHGIKVADFVKKLMGQIVFLYFLQKKGWLGVREGEKWGVGDKQFMKNLFEKKYRDYNNFFNDILEPLFYNTLNRKDRGNSNVVNDQSYSPYFKCRIPYLNGGLFTPAYDWEHTSIIIDNKYFENIFNIFDLFNFTVYESDPIEKEVAVDPEMLGKVFENLLEVNDRKSKGAFYTPREIVHYMCRESLINYLINAGNFPEKRMRDLMENKDVALAREESKQIKIENDQNLIEIAISVNNLLKVVKICDPAVGSGAFPMGLLKEITTLRFYLNNHFVKEKNKYDDLLSEYDIKKQTLENCIYGVDIDPGAVEIARLRFWLSMVVEHNIEDIEPLPNLDYKIMQGNSLIEDLVIGDSIIKLNFDSSKKTDGRTKEMKSLFEEETQFKLFLESSDTLVNQLEQYHSKFFKETDPEKKKILKNKIDNIENDLIVSKCEEEISRLNNFIKNIQVNTEIEKVKKQIKVIERTLNKWKKDHIRPFFPWRLHFAEIFAKGGFDIIIANPPYDVLNKTEGHKISDEELSYLRSKNIYKAAFGGKINLFRLFIALGISITKTSGVNTMIVPNALMGDRTSKGIREYCLNNTQFLFIEAFPERDNENIRLFKSVKMSTCIFSLLNKKNVLNPRFRVRTHYAREILNSVPTAWLTNQDILSFDSANLSIPLVDQTELIILKKISDPKNIILLKEIGRCYEGEINITFHKKFMTTDSSCSRMLKGAQIDRYRINNKMSQGIVEYLKESDYLSSNQGEKSAHHNYDRIVLQGITGVNEKIRLKMTIISKKIYCGNSLNYILINNSQYDPKYVLALLNSTLMNWYFKKFSTNSNVNGYEVDNLPIVKYSLVDQKQMIELVDKILIITSQSDYFSNQMKQEQIKELQRRIDIEVYRLYNLNVEEITTIENFRARN